ncbi:MAG: hypothetical protein IIA02_12050 [Proteobacteria bacterium]|uniref:hypothetical protein n=1 Tax=Aquabacterium sp. TaxID=1872578 RepID=UPI0035C6D0D5|nr:hypothetical protein [Pseudomonadota bacterium]
MQAVPPTHPATDVSTGPAAGGWQALASRQWRRLQARLRSTWRPLDVALLAPPHLPGEAAAIDTALDAFDAWADAHEGVHVAVQLSSRWLLCCATPEATSAAQARELAAQQWAHYFGIEPEQIAADWQLVELVHGEVKLVCAVPRALIAGLREVARERGLSLQAALPWWAEGLQRAWDTLQQDTPAATQPEGSLRQWAWSEPGLLTQAQAAVREGRWVLVRVWSEVVPDGVPGVPGEVADPALPLPELLHTLSPAADADAVGALAWTLNAEVAA